jgi:uncharacterized protein (DUF4415 family)
MSVNSIVRMSFEEARAKRDRGETRTRKDAPIGSSLGPNFWADAVVVEPQSRKSVHLRLQAEVYDFFVTQSGGKGHIKKMQQVLKAYVDAHK